MNERSPDFETAPHRVLGVTAEATAEEIRSAYLRKVKEYPPDREPEMFEAIRDAYHLMSDPRRRAQAILTGGDPSMPLVQLLDAQTSKPIFVGPQPWLNVLQQARRRGK